MNWIELALQALKFLTALVPAILELVKDMEQPGVKGEVKKQAVMDILKGIIDSFEKMGIRVPGTMILSLASYVVDGVVAAYNAIGVFNHGSSKSN